MAENNNEKKIELEEGEIMRISITCVDSEKGEYGVEFASNGKTEVMIQGLMKILDEEFDLMCVPKEAMMGLAICIPCYDEEDKSEEDQNTEENSEE